MEWKRDEVVLLIDTYQRYPCLWNVKMKEYKCKDLRDAAMKEIYKVMNNVNSLITDEVIKKKIHTLRGQYKRELKFQRESRKSGAGTDNVFTPKLWCFNLFHFLQDDDIRRTQSSLDTVEMEEAFTSPDVEDIEELQSPTEATDSSETSSRITTPIPPTTSYGLNLSMTSALSNSVVDENATPCSSHESSKGRKRKREVEEDGNRELFAAAVKRLSTPREEDDEFKAFSRSVGFELRTINRQNTLQCKLAKKIINEVLFMASMETLTLDSKVLNVTVSDMFSI